MPPFILHLASTSPRRRELLAQVGIRFCTVAVAVPEQRRAHEAPEVYALRLAIDKARAGSSLVADERPVLGADTVVELDGLVLEKPVDDRDALTMLERLSGRTHHVYTAVALAAADGEVRSRLSVSTVCFRETTAAERTAYVASGEPHDKAGGYGIQGLAAVFIERLEGSYSGVMGLPLFETTELLAECGIAVPDLWEKKNE